MIDAKLIRIITGEEIVAEVLSETDDTITVQNGLVVLPTQSSVGFAPWATVISKDKPEITVSKTHIVTLLSCKRTLPRSTMKCLAARLSHHHLRS